MDMPEEMQRMAEADVTRENVYELREYVIRDGKRHPFALIIPGGGYEIVANFVEGHPFAAELNRLGYSAFVLYYRIKTRYPAPQEDVARALRDILSRADELGVEREGWSLWGSSAGGHLAASFATDNMGSPKYGLPRPGTLVLVYPVITMGEMTHEGSRINLLGADASEEAIEFASVERHITPNYPPTFVWCGLADDVVPPCNSEWLAAELERNGVPYRFNTYPGVGHGTGLGRGLACDGWFEDAVKFWEEQLGRSNR